MRSSAAAFILLSFLLSGSLSAQSGQNAEEQVRALYDTGHWEEAAQFAASVEAPSASLLVYRGLALARLHRLSQALLLFKSGEQRFPSDKRFPLELAGISYRNGDYKDAKHYLRRALRLDSADQYGNEFLGSLYLLDGNMAAALEYWNRLNRPLLARVDFAPEPPLNTILRARTFDMSAGQVLTLRQIRISEANLTRLQVLASTHFDLASDSSGERFNLVVRSTPVSLPIAGWPGRLLPMLRELPYQTVRVDMYNPRGNGLNFTSMVRWDPNKRRVALNLSGPLAGNPRIEYRYFLDARDEIWDLRRTYRSLSGGLADVSLRSAAAGAMFELGLSSRMQWSVGGVVSVRRFRNADGASFFSNGWIARIDNRLDYSLLDSPHRRLQVKSWAVLDAGHVFSRSPSRLVTVSGGLRATWLPQAKGDKYSVVSGFQIGRTFGNVPLDELFVLGMERDDPSNFWLRGHVATRDGRKGNAPLGREFAISQSELTRRVLEFPLLRFDAGPFLDLGRAGNPSQALGSRGWLVDTGIQLKVKTIGGMTLRLVYGRNLRGGNGVFYSDVSRVGGKPGGSL